MKGSQIQLVQFCENDNEDFGKIVIIQQKTEAFFASAFSGISIQFVTIQ